MKKLLLALSLLASQPLAFANGCSYGWLTIYYNIQNNTKYDIKVGNATIGKQSSGVYLDTSSANANVCNGGSSSRSATYTANNETGTLKLTFNTCDDVSASSTPNSTPDKTFPFACPAASSHKDSDTHMCTGGMVYPAPEYTLNAYFTFDEKLTYTLSWTNIIVDLAKGQNIADKLAALFNKDSSHSDIKAQYTGNTLSISFTGTPTTPYTTGSSCSTA